MRNGSEGIPEERVKVLLNVLSIFQTGRTTGCDLKVLGGVGQAAIFGVSSKLYNWFESSVNI